MAIKLLLEITDSNGVITRKNYLKGGLRMIANDFPEYEYHQLRAIYLKCMSLENKKMHRSTLQIMERLKIYDYNANNEVVVEVGVI